MLYILFISFELPRCRDICRLCLHSVFRFREGKPGLGSRAYRRAGLPLSGDFAGHTISKLILPAAAATEPPQEIFSLLDVIRLAISSSPGPHRHFSMVDRQPLLHSISAVSREMMGVIIYLSAYWLFFPLIKHYTLLPLKRRALTRRLILASVRRDEIVRSASEFSIFLEESDWALVGFR